MQLSEKRGPRMQRPKDGNSLACWSHRKYATGLQGREQEVKSYETGIKSSTGVHTGRIYSFISIFLTIIHILLLFNLSNAWHRMESSAGGSNCYEKDNIGTNRQFGIWTIV